MEEIAAVALGFPLIDLPVAACADQAAVIGAMLGHLAAQGCFTTPAPQLAHLVRPSLHPELGVAFPRLRNEAVSFQAGVIARCAEGVAWGPTAQIIHVACMIVTPRDLPGDHLRRLHDAVNAFHQASHPP